MTSPGGGFSALTDLDWEKELQLNLLASTRLDRALLPRMLENKSGVIVHISSMAGMHPLWELNMAYAASKAALNSYSKALANEVASKGVRVLTVSPGGVATPQLVQLLEQFGAGSGATVAETFTNFANKFGGVPMGRMAPHFEISCG
jgi:NAD(P)-dependent dehydrogenase (short-subunit alcohol dehydrogenase family)